MSRIAPEDLSSPQRRRERRWTLVQRGAAAARRMLRRMASWAPAVALAIAGLQAAYAADAAGRLRLVPFPKQVRIEAGAFDFQRGVPELEASALQQPVLERLLSEELRLAQLPAARRGATFAEGRRRFRIAWGAPKAGAGSDAAGGTASRADSGLHFRPSAGGEDYRLLVRPDEILCVANGDTGLIHGMQTLRQLIRANRRGGSIPCVTIVDWPALRWRAFQDDMTRGPSSKLSTLTFEVDTASLLKLNLMTYYMEHQFAFKKHPKIGPPDGSLTPEDLRALVAYAKPLGVDVLGNQQSFGHFGAILAHPEYASLRESADVLSPVNDDSYKLLDDMYSEVCPLLPLEFFNVCCDETWDLGTGPSKALVQKIGVGGVYVRHIRRVHDLLRDKHGKRMMMWGDIILQHPGNLREIPKDTIMLTWAYDPRANFEDQILPFAKSGYEFFVCPGVSNWSRILPDFSVATTNIRNFVRDGSKHGAMGMINTDWEDDGEAINAVKWHADAWAAECAWNASRTSLDDFRRCVGAVLFGESGDRFGRAVERLGQTHRLPGMQNMLNSRFWENDFAPTRSPKTIERSAADLLAIVEPAIADLEACRKQAVANRQVVEAILFGARRMERIALRMRAGLDAARLYAKAAAAPPGEVAALLDAVAALLKSQRDAHDSLGKQFAAMWTAESKPYALDRVMARYREALTRYDALLVRLAGAKRAAAEGKPLPTPETMGLVVPESFGRRTRPHRIAASPLKPQSPWVVVDAAERIGLSVSAGNVDRHQLPIEVQVRAANAWVGKPVRAFVVSNDGQPPREIPAQLDASETPGTARLVVVLDRPLLRGSEATIHAYLAVRSKPAPLPTAASGGDAPGGMRRLANEKVRLLLGPEGAHIYRWEVKSLKNRDVTEPGESGWAGFADAGFDNRAARFRLDCLAQGPALVRYRCVTDSGVEKTVSLFAGMSWAEVVLNDPVGYYWDFDDPRNFAADGPTPGTYLFSTGKTGPVGRQADGVSAQVKEIARWAVKWNAQKLALGLVLPEATVLPEAKTQIGVAPGSGAGGLGIEGTGLVSHFVTFAGLLETGPAETMTRLGNTLDFRNPPEVSVFESQTAPK